MANLFSMHYTLQKLIPLEAQNTIEGGKGHAKTTLLMLYIVLYLSKGKTVFLNFDLTGWWPDLIARIHFGKSYDKKTPEELRDYYLDVMSRAYRFDQLDDLYPIRPIRKKGENPEGQFLFGLDEASMYLNSRSYQERMNRARDRYGSANKETSWFSMMRKLGFHGVALAQNAKDLDAQWRNQRGYTIRSKNLAKDGVYGFRSPVSFFRTIVKSPTGVEGKFWWTFPTWLSDCYDSWAIFDDTANGGLRYQYDPSDPFNCRRLSWGGDRVLLAKQTGDRKLVAGGGDVAGRDVGASQHVPTTRDGARELPSHDLPDFA